MRLTLRTKILLLVAGTVTSLALSLMGAISLLASREINRTVRRDVAVTGGVLTQLLDEHATALTDKCLLLASQPRLKYLRDAHDEQTVADSLSEWLPQMHASAALLTDQDGKLLGATDSAVVELRDGQHDPGVTRALQGQSWAGVVTRGEKLMLEVSVPVVDGVSKEVLLTFTVFSAIDAEVAQQLKKAIGSEVAFVREGKVVGATLPLPAHIPTPAGTPTLITLGHTRWFALYASLPNTKHIANTGFVTLLSYNRAMAPYRRFQQMLIGAFALAMALALLAGTWLAQGLTRPLDGVVQAAETLRRGAWPERFEIRRRDEIGLLQSVFNEMTVSLRDSQERLLALIDSDPLTGLDNHRRFQERLDEEAKRCRASGETLTLFIADLDHFQTFNQEHGHVAGDEALKRAASLLRERAILSGMPEQAILSRYGGEEFAALLPGYDLSQAERFAEQFRESVAAAQGGTGLTLSVGIAEFGTHSTQAEGLALAAELALSQAKQLGRNRICQFSSVPGADSTADPYHLYRSAKDGSLATIQALAAAVDAKDPYTQGHSQRVAEYASELARALALPSDVTELIYTTGTLHDVGKIGVPDAILKKPGRLEPEERTIMETHPVLGEVIVRKVPQLAATLPGVRHHHEAWDGTGYPDRLAGEAIPYIARVLAIADTFDAMTSDRPYRKGLDWNIALDEITKKSGTQFDPELAPAFVELMRPSADLRHAA